MICWRHACIVQYGEETTWKPHVLLLRTKKKWKNKLRSHVSSSLWERIRHVWPRGELSSQETIAQSIVRVARLRIFIIMCVRRVPGTHTLGQAIVPRASCTASIAHTFRQRLVDTFVDTLVDTLLDTFFLFLRLPAVVANVCALGSVARLWRLVLVCFFPRLACLNHVPRIHGKASIAPYLVKHVMHLSSHIA